MKLRGLLLAGWLMAFMSGACSAPQPTLLPTVVQEASPTFIAATSTPAITQESSADWTAYRNDAFGLSFLFPSSWFGPEGYEVGKSLRIEIGSDRVYPYGTDRLERVYTITNSYYIVIQHQQNTEDQSFDEFRKNQPWIETYVALLGLHDGESISDSRNLATRVRAVKLRNFEGLEYLSTLSETAQTEMYYTRQVVLFDQDLNILHITGAPENVEIPNREEWKAVYQAVDEAHLGVFYKVLESITIE